MPIIICEVKAGIDPGDTNLVTDPNEYWLEDESRTCTLTHYSGVVAGNLWQVDGEALELNQSGTTSVCWELVSGTELQVI